MKSIAGTTEGEDLDLAPKSRIGWEWLTIGLLLISGEILGFLGPGA